MNACGIGLALWSVMDGSAQAQAPKPSPGQPRIHVSGNGGYQATSNDFRQRTTFTEHFEEGSFDTAYPVKSGPQFDVGGWVRAWKNLALGATVSRFRKSGTADVTAQIPHPFFFAQNRQIQGSTGVDRSELAAHVQATWLVPVTNRVDVALMGGPSWFNVEQGIVSRVNYRDSYPYDSATFAAASIERQSKSALGFNAGVDLTVRFSRYAGVGGFVRFSRASVELNGAADSINTGGAQMGSGLRLRF
jgi:hypothetical protein